MQKGHIDKILFFSSLFLLVAGFLILFSASLGLKNRDNAEFNDVIINQLILGVGVGLILMTAASKFDYRKLKRFALPLFIFSLLLTLLVFIPKIGVYYGGAKRWLSIFGFSFQPSELLKFGFIVFLASWLSSRKEEVRSLTKGVLPFVIMLGVIGFVIIKQPDMGTFLVLALTGVVMFWLGGAKLKHIFLIFIVGVLALFILIKIEPYRMSRWTVFLNQEADQTDTGYQLKQSKIALGAGGIFGRGFGMGVQKFKFLPEPIGDSVFSVFGEEFGFVGTTCLIGFFMLFTYRGLVISRKAPDSFGRILGSGIVILIITQSFVNIASMTGMVPMTGVPLLFVSKGGSSLAITLLQIGVLFNISKHRT